MAEDHRDEIAAKALLELYNEWEKEGKPDELKISTIVPNAADDVRSQITRRTVLIFLELVYPGLSILSILARDLGVFVIWGLPMAWIIAMQETLRETSTRLGSATGLCGDLLGLVVVKSGRCRGRRTAQAMQCSCGVVQYCVQVLLATAVRIRGKTSCGSGPGKFYWSPPATSRTLLRLREANAQKSVLRCGYIRTWGRHRLRAAAQKIRTTQSRSAAEVAPRSLQ